MNDRKTRKDDTGKEVPGDEGTVIRIVYCIPCNAAYTALSKGRDYPVCIKCRSSNVFTTQQIKAARELRVIPWNAEPKTK